MTLRPAQTSDASSIAALSIEVWTGTYLKQGISGFFADYVLDTFTPSKIRALICDPTQFIMVSQAPDGINGVVRLSSNSTRAVEGCSDWEIATLYVQPRHHGKGIGARLLAAAVLEAKAQGAGTVWLTTNSQNTPAIEFYLAHGFRKIGTTYFKISETEYLNDVLSYALG